MTRKEAIEFYVELKKSGKLGEFNRKHPKRMTPKERDLFYFDDGQVFYNTIVGDLDYEEYDPMVHTQKIDDKIFDSLLSGERNVSDLTNEERKGLGID